MSLYKTFKTNPDIEKEGVLLEYGVNDAGNPITIRIARAGGSNVRFTKLMEIKTKPYRRQLQMEIMDAKLAESLFMEVYAETVVLGWENVEDENGQPIPFSKEACIKLFRDLPDLFADVRDMATKSALFRSELREADAGN